MTQISTVKGNSEDSLDQLKLSPPAARSDPISELRVHSPKAPNFPFVSVRTASFSSFQAKKGDGAAKEKFGGQAFAQVMGCPSMPFAPWWRRGSNGERLDDFTC